ncbi:MAG: hypothetical protein J0L58_16820 [Burkholderiales bacterium]|nr:hypothetical protein [Burkholderiales bacterium]
MPMGVSGITGAGSLPGLSVRAWVLFDGATGTIRKQFNVAGVVRNSAGNHTITLSAAMPDVRAVAQLQPQFGSAGAVTVGASIGSTTTATVLASLGGTPTDPTLYFVALHG